MPFRIGFGFTTLGVPNSHTTARIASVAASASFGTLFVVPFNSASTTTSEASSSHSSSAVFVARSTVFGRPFIPFATTFAINPAACLLA
eukprot:31380-Pelagococcus_subviridis.AAC.15